MTLVNQPQSLLIFLLCFRIFFLFPMYVAQRQQKHTFFHTVALAFLHSETVILYSFGCIFTRHVNIADGIIYLIEEILVFRHSHHFVQPLYDRRNFRLRHHFSLPYSGIEGQFVFRIHFDTSPVCGISFPVLSLSLHDLAEQIIKPCFLCLIPLFLHGLLQQGYSLRIFFLTYEQVGIRHYETHSLRLRQTVIVHFIQSIFSLIIPVEHGITFGHSYTSL